MSHTHLSLKEAWRLPDAGHPKIICVEQNVDLQAPHITQFDTSQTVPITQTARHELEDVWNAYRQRKQCPHLQNAEFRLVPPDREEDEDSGSQVWSIMEKLSTHTAPLSSSKRALALAMPETVESSQVFDVQRGQRQGSTLTP